MNASTNTTKARRPEGFPVPYSYQYPSDDLDAAISMLRVVTELMGDGRGCDREFMACLCITIDAAKDRLEPILIHLREIDRTDRSDRYLAARRQWILEHSGEEVGL
ncbi:MAG: hypothetical protein M9905_12175 [Rhizobiaceae bacterium]|nr:hypothetical protein [Rhizobiaceae bacterium]